MMRTRRNSESKLQWAKLFRNRNKAPGDTTKKDQVIKPKKKTSKAGLSIRKPLSTLSINGKDSNNSNSQKPVSSAKLDKRVKELSQSNDVGFIHFGDIMRSLRTKESMLLTDIDSEYVLNTQHTITWTMRSLLTEWILDIQAQYGIMDESVFAVINYIDCYLSKHPVDKDKLQLLGVTAMNLSSKTYEVRPQSIHEWLYLSQGQYTRKDVLTTERKLLETINWNIFQVTPYNYSSSWMRVLCVPAPVQFLFDFVIRVVYVDSLCLKHKVSHLTAAAICLAFVYMRRRHELDVDLMTAVAEHDPFQGELIGSLNEVICAFVGRERTSVSPILSFFGGNDDDKARSSKYGTNDDEMLTIDTVDFKRVFEEYSNKPNNNNPIKKL